MTDPEQVLPAKSENQRTVDALRERFARLSERLTPEIQPAPIYLPYLSVLHPSSPEDAE